jgi:hypothetical protein
MNTRPTPRLFSTPELIYKIFSHLSNSSNSASAQVCKAWSEIALDILWKDVVDLRHLFSQLPSLVEDENGLVASIDFKSRKASKALSFIEVPIAP